MYLRTKNIFKTKKIIVIEIKLYLHNKITTDSAFTHSACAAEVIV